MANKTFSITLENRMFGYERPRKTFLIQAEDFREALVKAREQYNDIYADLVEWKEV